jgi:hypothetical protein
MAISFRWLGLWYFCATPCIRKDILNISYNSSVHFEAGDIFKSTERRHSDSIAVPLMNMVDI